MTGNVEWGTRRRYVLIQLPEPTRRRKPNGEWEETAASQAGFPTISEITKERLRRAGSAVRSANPNAQVDLGFRAFRLAASNIATWNPDSAQLKESLLGSMDHIVSGRDAQDVLYEVLLKLGLDLCVPIEERVIAGVNVQFIGGGVLVTCLTDHLNPVDALAIAEAIPAILKELGTTGEITCVFRDSAFNDDVTKTNVAAILEQNGIARVRSL
jgi:adenine-specific DNA-methyltransferase